MEMEKRLLQVSLGGCRVVSLWFFALLHSNPFSRWSWCPFRFLETMILLTFYDDQVSASGDGLRTQLLLNPCLPFRGQPLLFFADKESKPGREGGCFQLHVSSD